MIRAPSTRKRFDFRAQYDRRRPTSTQVGLGYGWGKASKAYLAEHPLCRSCEIRGLTTAATCTDHIITREDRPDLMWERWNWQSLCGECHSHKTWCETRGWRITWPQRDDRYVVFGKPASGKTFTAMSNYQDGDIVWDMDQTARRLGFADFPRPAWQHERLCQMRAELIRRIEETGHDGRLWLIVTAPDHAHATAKRLRGTLVHCWCDDDERAARLALRHTHGHGGGGGRFAR